MYIKDHKNEKFNFLSLKYVFWNVWYSGIAIICGGMFLWRKFSLSGVRLYKFGGCCPWRSKDITNNKHFCHQFWQPPKEVAKLCTPFGCPLFWIDLKLTGFRSSFWLQINVSTKSPDGFPQWISRENIFKNVITSIKVPVDLTKQFN